MKRAALVLWLLCRALTPLSAQSSAPAPDPVRQYLDNLVAPLDKAQLPAPFLEEYGRRLVPLDVFNGALTDSSRTNLQVFRLAYATLLTSHLTGTHTLPTLATVNARLRAQQAASTAIPVLLQRLDYAALRADALTADLLTAQNGQLHDVPGRSQSPYQLHTLFMAAPAQSEVPTGDVHFIFPQSLHLRSGGGSLRSLSLDFGDGRGYLPVTLGQPIGANYCTAGTYRVKVRASYALSTIYGPAFTSGTTKQSQA